MPDLDRKALSERVLYPENAAFVLMGEGDVFPMEEIMVKVRKRAAHHGKRSGGIDVFFILGSMGLVMTGLMLWVFVRDFSQQRTLPETLGWVSAIICMVLFFLFIAAFFFSAIYFERQFDKNPEEGYLDHLKSGSLTLGTVYLLEPFGDGRVRFTYGFNRDINPARGPTRTERCLGTWEGMPRFFLKDGDQVVVLYSTHSVSRLDSELHVLL